MAVSGRKISFGKLMTGFGDRTKTGMKNFAFAGKKLFYVFKVSSFSTFQNEQKLKICIVSTFKTAFLTRF